MSLIFHSVPFPITKIVELFVALLENFKISSESKTPVIFILTATYTTRPTFIDILLIMDTLLGTVTPKRELLFYAVDHPCILAAVSNIQFGSIACTEYSNHYSISVSHYNSFSIYRNSFSTHSNIFDDRESELYVSFISKRSNVSVWERVTILLLKNPC